MATLVDRSRISWFNFLYLFLIIIYAGGATKFATSFGNIKEFGNAFGLLMTIMFYQINKVKLTRKAFVPIFVVTLFFCITTAVYNTNTNLALFVCIEWAIKILAVYGLCIVFGKRFFPAFESIMCMLCLISLLLWVLQVVSPSTLTNLVRTFEFSQPYDEDNNVLANMLVYTLNDQDYGNQEFNYLVRNSGFCWEPGAFSSLICFAIFCNILRTNLKIRNNRSIIVLVVTLASTQSTTGLGTFLFILAAWCIVNKKFKYVIVLLPLAFYVLSLSFMSDKISAETETLETINLADRHGPLGRFISWQLSWEEFLRHPLIGYGADSNNTYLNQSGYDVGIISGVGVLISKFGALMTLLFIILLISTSRKLSEIFGTPSAYILPGIFIGVLISYVYFDKPLLMTFWLFGYFQSSTKKTVITNC